MSMVDPASVPSAVRSFLDQRGLHAGNVLVALSGGADSCALAAAVASLSDGAPVQACWVDHGIRPKDELAAERDFVVAFCASLGMRLHTRAAEPGRLVAEAKLAGGLEAAARTFRLRVLDEMRESLGLAMTLTGHHAGDARETLVMRFFSGSSSAGLAGLRPDSGHVGRPFLGLERGDLEAYLGRRGLSWRDDSTNAGDEYLRNKVRHKLVPVIEEVFPGWRTALRAGAEKALADDQALTGMALSLLDGDGIDADILARAPRALRERALFALADTSGWEGKRLSWRLVSAAAARIDELEAGVPLTLAEGSGLVMRSDGRKVTVRELGAEPATPDFCLVAPAPGDYVIGMDGRCRLYWATEGLRNDAFSWPLVIRSRKPGDAMRTAAGRTALDKILARDGRTPALRGHPVILEDRDGIVGLSLPGGRYVWRYNPGIKSLPATAYLRVDLKGVAPDDATRR